MKHFSDMKADIWHYSRHILAKQVLGMFESGLSSALVFFAPRRMGKTEFLRKDIMPLAQEKDWAVFYFSFLEVDDHADDEFMEALLKFSKTLKINTKSMIPSVKGEVEFQSIKQKTPNIKDILENLSEKRPVLLLMDEVQILAKNVANEHFIAALRTALDIHKDTIKVIFTGSSQAGLRRMFSKATAPFFHFGQNLSFPELPRAFTDHLANILFTVTSRHLDKDALWNAFGRMQKVPQLARSLVERLALNPQDSLDEACDQLLADIYNDRAFVDIWEKSTILSRILLKEISMGKDAFFSEVTRNRLAVLLGIETLSVSLMQSSLRHLEHNGLIGRMPEKMGEYVIDDPNFKNWLMHKETDGNLS